MKHSSKDSELTVKLSAGQTDRPDRRRRLQTIGSACLAGAYDAHQEATVQHRPVRPGLRPDWMIGTVIMVKFMKNKRRTVEISIAK